MENSDLIISGFVFILGACIGSFLNVCIVRMPQNKSIVFPSSHCVKCNKPLAWYDNIPLFSYLLLGGRCRYCREKFSVRYFVVEFLTAAVFVVLYLRFGFSPALLAYMIMAGGLLVSTFIDFEHRIIPDEISLGGIVVGIVLSIFIPQMHELEAWSLNIGKWIMWVLVAICFLEIGVGFLLKKDTVGKDDLVFMAIITGLLFAERGVAYWAFTLKDTPQAAFSLHLLSFQASLIGFLVGGGLIYAMGVLGDVIFKKESMGGGDVKLLAMIGAFLGWKLSVLAFFIAPIFGAVFGIVEKIRTKDSAIAYGPFLSLGALISLLFGEAILAWILGGYGLYNIY